MSILEEGDKSTPVMEMSSEERTIRFVAKIIAGVLLLIVFSITSCTMHSNTFDKERLIEETKMEAVETEQIKAQQQTEQLRIQTMEKLIAQGQNPVAVRCAFDKQLSGEDKRRCTNLGFALSGKSPRLSE